MSGDLLGTLGAVAPSALAGYSRGRARALAYQQAEQQRQAELALRKMAAELARQQDAATQKYHADALAVQEGPFGIPPLAAPGAVTTRRIPQPPVTRQEQLPARVKAVMFPKPAKVQAVEALAGLREAIAKGGLAAAHTPRSSDEPHGADPVCRDPIEFLVVARQDLTLNPQGQDDGKAICHGDSPQALQVAHGLPEGHVEILAHHDTRGEHGNDGCVCLGLRVGLQVIVIDLAEVHRVRVAGGVWIPEGVADDLAARLSAKRGEHRAGVQHKVQRRRPSRSSSSAISSCLCWACSSLEEPRPANLPNPERLPLGAWR